MLYCTRQLQTFFLWTTEWTRRGAVCLAWTCCLCRTGRVLSRGFHVGTESSRPSYCRKDGTRRCDGRIMLHSSPKVVMFFYAGTSNTCEHPTPCTHLATPQSNCSSYRKDETWLHAPPPLSTVRSHNKVVRSLLRFGSVCLGPTASTPSPFSNCSRS